MTATIDLTGKVALVTGAGSGIGKQSAKTLADAGATVVCTDVNEDTAKATAAEIREAGGKADGWAHDVVSESQWAATMGEIVEDYGRLDVLLNNAGIELLKTMAETSIEEFRRVLDINVTGVFLGMKAASAVMAKQGTGGSIINLSSVAGIVGAPRQVAYCGSKGGVRLMTKAAALEMGVASSKVRVNSIHPGIIETPMYEAFFDGMDEATAAARRAHLQRLGVVGRIGQPMDIANAVLFLASDLSDFMTGSEIVVDGGMTAS